MKFAMKMAALGAALVASVGVAAADEAGGAMKRILEEKVVRMGAVDAFPSYRQDLASGKWEGIFPEIAEALFGPIGVKVEFVPTEWGTAAAGLQSGRFDIVGGFSATPERALVVAFSQPVAQVGVGVASASGEAGAKAADWAALNDPAVRIALTDGSATMRMVQKMAPNATYVAVKAEDAAIMELESGRVDYFAAPETSLSRYAGARDGKVTLTYPAPKIGQNSTIALPKGEAELQEWLSVSIGALVADGTIPAIRAKWLAPAK